MAHNFYLIFLNVSVLVYFPVAMIKFPDERSLRKGFIESHSSKVHFIMGKMDQVYIAGNS